MSGSRRMWGPNRRDPPTRLRRAAGCHRRAAARSTLEVDVDLAAVRARRAGHSVVRTEVALLAFRFVDDAVAAEEREPAAPRASADRAVAGDVAALAEVAVFEAVDDTVTAIVFEPATGRAAAVRRVLVGG